MTRALLTLLSLLAPMLTAAALAQAPPSAESQAQAYLSYLRGQRLEGDDDQEGAVAAYREAAKLDPRSAAPQSALAVTLLKRERNAEAATAAEAALALDPTDGDANWVVGMLTAEPLDDNRELTAEDRATAKRALEYLEKARASRRFDLNLMLTIGRLYLAVDDATKAIEQFTQLLDETGPIGQVISPLAEAYEKAGRREDAIELLEASVGEARRGQGAMLLVELARLYEREHRWTDAAGAYSKALGTSYRSVELRLRQASALSASGDMAGARDVLRELVKAQPNDANALFALADAERDLGEFAAAEATARRLASQEGDGFRGSYLLGRILAEQQKYREVVAATTPAVERGLKAAGPSSQILALVSQLGSAHVELGEVDKAVALYERLKRWTPLQAAPDVSIAQAYIQARQYDKAASVAEAARAKYPNDPRLLRLQALAYQESGRADRAVTLLTEARKAGGGDPLMSVAIAQAYADASRFAEAERELSTASTSFPEDIDVRFQLGALHERQKKYVEAEQAFRKVLELDPDHGPTLNYLGYMLAERGERLDEAVKLINKALEAEPNNGSYLDSLGWAYFRQNSFDLAKEHLSKAAAQLPRNSVVQDHYAEVLLKLGDKAGAADAWRKALAGDLRDVSRQTLQQKLKKVQ